jgi:hypothetical protein
LSNKSPVRQEFCNLGPLRRTPWSADLNSFEHLIQRMFRARHRFHLVLKEFPDLGIAFLIAKGAPDKGQIGSCVIA